MGAMCLNFDICLMWTLMSSAIYLKASLKFVFVVESYLGCNSLFQLVNLGLFDYT